MVHGEFESMKIYHALVPDFAVRPIGYGTCASSSDTHFYISDFKFLSDDITDTTAFCQKAAEMHNKSARLHEQTLGTPEVPDNFGFHVTTHTGMLPHDNRWQHSWEKFFTHAIISILAFEEKTQGPSEELDFLANALIQKVIPRLLRPLETGGKSIRPVLVHGDLQLRNARMDLTTGRPVMYDAGAFWGHNECK